VVREAVTAESEGLVGGTTATPFGCDSLDLCAFDGRDRDALRPEDGVGGSLFDFESVRIKLRLIFNMRSFHELDRDGFSARSNLSHIDLTEFLVLPIRVAMSSYFSPLLRS